MNTDYKVQETNLNSEIRNSPIEVLEEMVEYQVKQGNKPDVKVFRRHTYIYPQMPAWIDLTGINR